MINAITRHISFFLGKQEPKKYLGRWTMEYCQVALDNKIARANEDNCGPCGSICVVERTAKEHRPVIVKMNRQKQNNYTKYIEQALNKRNASYNSK